MDVHHFGASKKTFYLNYCGKISFHHAYSPYMTKWLIASVRLLQTLHYCSINVSENGISAQEEDDILVTFENSSHNAPLPSETSISESQKSFCSGATAEVSFPLPMVVPLKQIVEVVVPSESDRDCASFIVNHGYDTPLQLHVFQCDDLTLIEEIRNTLNDFVSPSHGQLSGITNVRLEDANSVRFEVKLLGKVQPRTDSIERINFVDEAVDQYLKLESHHLAMMSKEQSEKPQKQLAVNNSATSEKRVSVDSERTSISPKEPKSHLDFDRNKTRIFQVGKQSVTLIASDQSTRNVEILYSNMEDCVKGEKHPDHFGINVQEITYHGRRGSRDEAKVRCFVFKCPDESVCFEILQSTKQASATCLNGPDPMLEYQTLCRRISTSASSSNLQKFEKGMAAATKCISNLSSDEQKKVRQNIDEQCIKIPPQTRYDHLVIVMEMIRRIYEERQAVHDIKSKQAPVSSHPNSVTKQLAFWKNRAKKSLFSIENLWEKHWHDKPGDNDHPGRLSATTPSRVSPRYSRRQSPDNQTTRSSVSAPTTPAPAFKYTESPLANKNGNTESQNTMVLDHPPGTNSATEAELKTESARESVKRQTAELRHPHDVSSDGNNIAAASKVTRAKSGEVHSRLSNEAKPSIDRLSARGSKGRSFSTPYLRRLLNILPDVQESPGEGDPPPKMKSSGFSFSKLLRGGDNLEAKPHHSECESGNNAIEMKDFKKKCDPTHPRSFPIYPVIQHHIHEEESLAPSDVSSDEDDHGIFFTAQTPARNILQPAPKVKLSSEADVAYSPSPQTRSISERRHSAFSEFKPKAAENVAASPSHLLMASSELAEETATQTDDELEEINGSTLGALPTTSHFEDAMPGLLNRPVIRKTIHQKIFSKIGSAKSKSSLTTRESPLNINDFKKSNGSLNSAGEIREAWQQNMEDQALLSKIQELASLPENISSFFPVEAEVDLSDDMAPIWLELLNAKSRNLFKVDRTILHAAVLRSVPAHLRGQIWIFLYEQWKFRQKCCSTVGRGINYPDVPYESLLKELTSHQHAILIDLGRTFPTHPYFCRQLGNGQLALFNLLKAYSLVDTEVGYCQGLSFVAGVILINMSSQTDAFDLLCHLMIDMNCRKLYRPDMSALRVAVYQLARLLYDFHSDLFKHFDDNEVTLMLFATPWFLTMFSSILSLSLTARIFDMLFLEGISALFKAALSLLSAHKEKLMQEVGFENIMGYLKNNLPLMDDAQAQSVINEMFSLDIGQRLRIYEAEYNVLEEADLISEDHKSLENYITHLENSYAKLFNVHLTTSKRCDELEELHRASKNEIYSLRQGMYDMGRVEEQRMLELDDLRKENRFYRRSITPRKES